MPLNGSGTYNLPNPPVFPAVAGTTIKASDFNAIMTDMAAAISAMIARDGQSTITGVLQWALPAANLAALGGVALTGAQTIAGVKTFSSAPVSSAAAAAANELMRKGEVDSAVAGRAALAGSGSQTFSVAPATDPAHAVRLGQYTYQTSGTPGTAGFTWKTTRPDGVIEIGGIVTYSSDVQTTITFPFSGFPNECWDVLVARQGSDMLSPLGVVQASITTTSFAVDRENNASGSHTFSYRAIGR